MIFFTLCWEDHTDYKQSVKKSFRILSPITHIEMLEASTELLVLTLAWKMRSQGSSLAWFNGPRSFVYTRHLVSGGPFRPLF